MLYDEFSLKWNKLSLSPSLQFLFCKLAFLFFSLLGEIKASAWLLPAICEVGWCSLSLLLCAFVGLSLLQHTWWSWWADWLLSSSQAPFDSMNQEVSTSCTGNNTARYTTMMIDKGLAAAILAMLAPSQPSSSSALLHTYVAEEGSGGGGGAWKQLLTAIWYIIITLCVCSLLTRAPSSWRGGKNC